MRTGRTCRDRTGRISISMAEINDARALRNALGHFATGVTVVTAQAEDGRPAGVTINSFSSLSLEPPLVLWSLAKASASLPVFLAASHFAVHVLAANQQALSDRFAKPAANKFDDLDHGMGLGRAPLLTGCAAVFECALQQCLDGGDHTILVGRVERFQTDVDALPLLFYRGRYVIPQTGGLFSPPIPLPVSG